MTDPSPSGSADAAAADSAAAFVARWRAADGSELANYQLFVTDLCRLLDVPSPDPAHDDSRDNAYVFERRVSFRHGDGSSSSGRIDCYKRGHFVLEAKKIRLVAASKGFDDALQRARGQAESYARALPADEGRPPFLVVVDVGHVIELYADFTRSGATYTPFPDPRSHRIKLADLAEPGIRERLQMLWRDPLALDPTRVSARVTRAIAGHLARIARTLEGAGHHPELVAGFLTRCLFSMFAEDVGLLPRAHGQGAFTTLLDDLSQNSPQQFVPLLAALWREMDAGGFSVVLRATLPRFNGKLFKQPEVHRRWIASRSCLLLRGRARRLDARSNRRSSAPCSNARSTPERAARARRPLHAAQPTSNAWCCRPSSSRCACEWAQRPGGRAHCCSPTKARLDAARAEVDRLPPPACATFASLTPPAAAANFLYVTLEHMKRLEGEVLEPAGDAFGRASMQRLEAEGLTVDPQQFLGLELNPRAAAIAELVLWIGYLQWHFRTSGSRPAAATDPASDFRNIECRDAVLACDGIEFASSTRARRPGQPLERRDLRKRTRSPASRCPTKTPARRSQRYINPRQRRHGRQADYIVGNPPFIGAGRHACRARRRLRRSAAPRPGKRFPNPPTLVMFWWHHAAGNSRRDGQASQRFGLITTNSLKQTFNRRVVQAALR
jgi:hypothetical protein